MVWFPFTLLSCDFTHFQVFSLSIPREKSSVSPLCYIGTGDNGDTCRQKGAELQPHLEDWRNKCAKRKKKIKTGSKQQDVGLVTWNSGLNASGTRHKRKKNTFKPLEPENNLVPMRRQTSHLPQVQLQQLQDVSQRPLHTVPWDHKTQQQNTGTKMECSKHTKSRSNANQAQHKTQPRTKTYI